MLLLDLENCRHGYSPTHSQQRLFPAVYRPKIDVIFDGIETDIFRRVENVPRQIADRSIPASSRIVTYVSRGFESMRGFDIFMRVAERIYQQFSDVVFIVVGSRRVCYGGDEKHIKHKTFYEHAMAQSSYDMDKLIFTGLIPVSTLAQVFSLSDLHLYFTVPFVLSWSLMDALACGCTVLASDTAPVREMIEHGKNGLLCDFFDVEGFASQSVEVLRDPDAVRYLGISAVDGIHRNYAIDVTLPHLTRLFERAASSA
jgi:glycosyltransferase involved in cell wall biosynthesis